MLIGNKMYLALIREVKEIDFHQVVIKILTSEFANRCRKVIQKYKT